MKRKMDIGKKLVAIGTSGWQSGRSEWQFRDASPNAKVPGVPPRIVGNHGLPKTHTVCASSLAKIPRGPPRIVGKHGLPKTHTVCASALATIPRRPPRIVG